MTLSFLSAVAVLAASPPLEVRVDRMLHATHGVGAPSSPDLDPEARALCEDPKVLGLAEQRIAAERLDQPLNFQERRAADNAIGLLLAYCGPAGAAVVRTQIEALRLRRDARGVELRAVEAAFPQNPSLGVRLRELHLRVGRMAGVERTALQGLTALKDPGLVSTSLARLQSEPFPVIQLELVKYLSAAAPKSAQVHAALTALRQITHYPALLQAIDAYPKP